MKKNKFITVLLLAILLIGLSLLLYPTISNYWNSFTQSRAIADYQEKVEEIDEEDYRQYLEDAAAYNAALAEEEQSQYLDETRLAQYEDLLNVTGLGIMGYCEIPKIDSILPIYHGTEDSVLQIAIGHLDWTSLPVGGESTHCVLSGHRGLPSAELFTHLDRLAEGDTFILRILNETLTYEIDQILIVEPQEIEELKIAEGRDYCTLVTCTPYGINSHRLLVRGHRVENANDSTARVTADAVQLDPLWVAAVLAGIIVLGLLLLAYFPRRRNKNRKGVEDEND